MRSSGAESSGSTTERSSSNVTEAALDSEAWRRDRGQSNIVYQSSNQNYNDICNKITVPIYTNICNNETEESPANFVIWNKPQCSSSKSLQLNVGKYNSTIDNCDPCFMRKYLESGLQKMGICYCNNGYYDSSTYYGKEGDNNQKRGLDKKNCPIDIGKWEENIKTCLYNCKYKKCLDNEYNSRMQPHNDYPPNDYQPNDLRMRCRDGCLHILDQKLSKTWLKCEVMERINTIDKIIKYSPLTYCNTTSELYFQSQTEKIRNQCQEKPMLISHMPSIVKKSRKKKKYKLSKIIESEESYFKSRFDSDNINLLAQTNEKNKKIKTSNEKENRKQNLLSRKRKIDEIKQKQESLEKTNSGKSSENRKSKKSTGILGMKHHDKRKNSKNTLKKEDKSKNVKASLENTKKEKEKLKQNKKKVHTDVLVTNLEKVEHQQKSKELTTEHVVPTAYINLDIANAKAEEILLRTGENNENTTIDTVREIENGFEENIIKDGAATSISYQLEKEITENSLNGNEFDSIIINIPQNEETLKEVTENKDILNEALETTNVLKYTNEVEITAQIGEIKENEDEEIEQNLTNVNIEIIPNDKLGKEDLNYTNPMTNTDVVIKDVQENSLINNKTDSSKKANIISYTDASLMIGNTEINKNILEMGEVRILAKQASIEEKVITEEITKPLTESANVSVNKSVDGTADNLEKSVVTKSIKDEDDDKKVENKGISINFKDSTTVDGIKISEKLSETSEIHVSVKEGLLETDGIKDENLIALDNSHDSVNMDTGKTDPISEFTEVTKNAKKGSKPSDQISADNIMGEELKDQISDPNNETLVKDSENEQNSKTNSKSKSSAKKSDKISETSETQLLTKEASLKGNSLEFNNQDGVKHISIDNEPNSMQKDIEKSNPISEISVSRTNVNEEEISQIMNKNILDNTGKEGITNSLSKVIGIEAAKDVEISRNISETSEVNKSTKEEVINKEIEAEENAERSKESYHLSDVNAMHKKTEPQKEETSHSSKSLITRSNDKNLKKSEESKANDNMLKEQKRNEHDMKIVDSEFRELDEINLTNIKNKNSTEEIKDSSGKLLSVNKTHLDNSKNLGKEKITIVSKKQFDEFSEETEFNFPFEKKTSFTSHSKVLCATLTDKKLINSKTNKICDRFQTINTHKLGNRRQEICAQPGIITLKSMDLIKKLPTQTTCLHRVALKATNLAIDRNCKQGSHSEKVQSRFMTKYPSRLPLPPCSFRHVNCKTEPIISNSQCYKVLRETVPVSNNKEMCYLPYSDVRNEAKCNFRESYDVKCLFDSRECHKHLSTKKSSFK